MGLRFLNFVKIIDNPFACNPAIHAVDLSQILDIGIPLSLVFNKNSPPYFIGAAVLLGTYLFVAKNKKVIADDDGLISNKQTIAYDSIEAIDKTHFDSKGYFIITYKDARGKEARLKLSDRTYDNLSAVLDELVAKIS